MESSLQEDRLLAAIQASKKAPETSIKSLASMYDVPRTTLRRRLKGITSRRDAMPNGRKLNDLEEAEVLRHIKNLEAQGFPPRLSHVADMANRLLRVRDGGRVGKNWIASFLKRHHELRSKYYRIYDHKRAECESPDALNAWFQLVANMIAKYGVADADIYNFDETGFMMGVLRTAKVVTSSKKASKPLMVQPGNREWVTVIQGIGSGGYAVPPFIIVAGKNRLESWYQDSPLPPHTIITTSENGWTTNEKGLEWIQHFDSHTKTRTLGTYRILILDGHESHHSDDFLEYCEKNSIIPLCMPAHSSHLLQPLDVSCFGPLKQAYSQQIEMMSRAGTSHVTKEDFFVAFSAAFQNAFTEKNIQAGFRSTGLVPDYIINRIRRHENSSPTSIIDAVRQQGKATQVTMHRYTLIDEEFKISREELAAISKRRRAKKTRIRHEGSLSVSQAQDLIEQKDADVQVAQESRRSGGRVSQSKSAGRRCSNCGQTGHNIRTCDVYVNYVGEDDSE